MYKTKKNLTQMTLDFGEFSLPFGGKLDTSNRWIKLAHIIPWSQFEETYAQQFSESMGAGAISFRVALGALIIKERLAITDREAVDQIRENPYLQYFLGFNEFQYEAPFDASMYVHFRKRITHEMLSEINQAIIQAPLSQKSESNPQNDSDNTKPPAGNSGKLIIDATCTPADIRFPTDLSILNEAREKTEAIIDQLWESSSEVRTVLKKKPRTYRNRARKEFLNVIKKTKDKNKVPRKGIRKQLNYVNRNLKHITTLSETVSLNVLTKLMYKCLLVIHEVYRQQKDMYDKGTHRIENRIVSITQPHIRPIVRGKAGKKVEFGAKISASSFNGFSCVDRISWDAYNESEDLIAQAKKYKKRFGHFPSSIHADKIYLTRKNRVWCKTHSIRLSGPPLGRPKKITEANKNTLKLQNQITRQDEVDRIDIEGRFGHAKRRYSLGRVMAKLPVTSTSVISLVFLVMNLEKILRDLFLPLFLDQITNVLNIYSYIKRFIKHLKRYQKKIINLLSPVPKFRVI